jgi:hypothetical protein
MQTVTGKKYYDNPRYHNPARPHQGLQTANMQIFSAYLYHETPGGPEITRTYAENCRRYRCTSAPVCTSLAGRSAYRCRSRPVPIVYEWAVAHNAIVKRNRRFGFRWIVKLPEQEVNSLTERGGAAAFHLQWPPS